MGLSLQLLRILTGCVLLVLAGCGGSDSPTTPTEDRTAPATVSDLSADTSDDTSITLGWTATGDDGSSGTAAQYDLRYTEDLGDADGWDAWTEVAGEPAPRQAGQMESFAVTGLSPEMQYAFKLKVADEVPNWSAATPAITGQTAAEPDTHPPATVTDLAVNSSDASSLILEWTAPGDDGDSGQASSYELRFAEFPLQEGNWAEATTIAIDPPGPAGTAETVRVNDLRAASTYYFALRTADEATNWSDLSASVFGTTSAVRTWRVNLAGTGNAPTIQAAIDSATAGDLILVAPGRYTWTNQDTENQHDHFLGMIFFFRDVTGFSLRSEAGPEATIIDAQGHNRVFFFMAANDILLDGFTITGGDAGQSGDPKHNGGGIVSHLTIPVIKNCVITGNRAVEGGGVWYGGVGSPLFENCLIANNEAQYGGGVLLVNSHEVPVLSRCIIRDNHAQISGGGLYAAHIEFVLTNCAILNNTAEATGGGITLNIVHPSRGERLTVAGNRAQRGSGIRIIGTPPDSTQFDTTHFTLRNTVIAFNQGGAAFSDTFSYRLDLGCSDVYGHLGGDALPDSLIDSGGNFSLDPQFCAGGGDQNFNLRSTSPCAPGQHPAGYSCGTIGAYPVGCAEETQLGPLR